MCAHASLKEREKFSLFDLGVVRVFSLVGTQKEKPWEYIHKLHVILLNEGQGFSLQNKDICIHSQQMSVNAPNPLFITLDRLPVLCGSCERIKYGPFVTSICLKSFPLLYLEALELTVVT